LTARLVSGYNSYRGSYSEQDTLPKRLFDEPLKGGRSEGLLVPRAEFQQVLDLYYRMAGWDVETGLPTQAKLKELGWIEF